MLIEVEFQLKNVTNFQIVRTIRNAKKSDNEIDEEKISVNDK